MDGLVEELLRLESAKHQALVSIDAPAYDANVREQLRLLGQSPAPLKKVGRIDVLSALSKLIALNTRLLLNLLSTTPRFEIDHNSYSASGHVSPAPVPPRVSVEA
jgi:hypothetical protein